MKLIDIEGLDGCGKATQAAMLHSYYDSIGKKSTILEFPTISPIGFECQEFQRGRFGNPLKQDPIFSSLLYTMDRIIRFKEPFEDQHLHKDYDYVICDRYKMSNLICHLHKLKTDKEKFEYIEFMKKAESAIPQEDITIILTVPLEISIDLIKERSRDTKDLNESIEAQRIFHNNLFWIVHHIDYLQDIWSDKRHYEIKIIECSDIFRKLLSPGKIHQNIVSKIIQI